MREIYETDELCEKLNLSKKTKELAEKIRNKTYDLHCFLGRKPSVINAASVYFAALKNDEGIWFKDIKDITNVQEISIRRMTKMLSRELEIEIPEKYLFTTRNGIVHLKVKKTRDRAGKGVKFSSYKRQSVGN